jgi:Family of unknown function (DUF5681)
MASATSVSFIDKRLQTANTPGCKGSGGPIYSGILEFIHCCVALSMTENSAKNQSKPWQFQPGQSGNPRGKPKGARNHATRIVEQLFDKDARLLAAKARDMALAGDTVALKLCLERLCPPRKDRPINLDLPPIGTLADASGAMSKVIACTAAGELTPDEAGSVIALIDAKRRILADVDLEARVTALEASAKGGEHEPQVT